MNCPQDFCYWLQGFVELQDSDSISDKQWLVIKDHLKLVFDKNTPDRNDNFKITVDPVKPFDYKELIRQMGQTGGGYLYNTPYLGGGATC